jgi:uncharacterized protein YkwD
LVAAGQGRWTVTAEPAGSARITSPNPRVVIIAPYEKYVHTGIDFCLQSTAIGAAPVVEETPGQISERLLTTPPEPEPPANLEQVVAEPLAPADAEEIQWLAYLNRFRAMGGVPALVEDAALSSGAQLHSRYMVLADRPIAHSQSADHPLFTPQGHQAARNSNIFATTQVVADHYWSMNFWASAPFHLVPILDPTLESVGYGQYREAVGNFHMAAVLDVRSTLGDGQADAPYPLFFPGEGEETWVLRQSLYEWPDPALSCPGYARPLGPPLVLQLGDGGLSPRVNSVTLYEDGTLVEACAFSERSYTNPDTYEQATGRKILDKRDAVVVMPRRPLVGGATYRVVLVVDGETYEWSFAAATRAP